MFVTATVRRSAGLISVLALGALLGGGTAHALDATSTCVITKRKAAAKKAATKLGCVSRAVGKGIGVDSTCLAKAEVKFSTSFAKADAKGGCIPTNNTVGVEAVVDSCVSSIRSQLGVPSNSPPQSSCTALKLNAAGKKNRSKITCHNQSISRAAPVDSACLAKAEVKFSTAFTKAETKANCVTSNDRAMVEADVDACVSDIRTVTPTTSSTTTTTICDAESAAIPPTTGVTAAHNNVRANAQPPPNPPLIPLCYKAAIASTAQSWANNCNFVHSSGSGYGENLYGEANHNPTAATSAVNLWASEAADYDYATNTCSGSTCGHYRQIVSRNNMRLGCGVKYCTTGSPLPGFPNWTFVVCNYDPGSQSGGPGGRPY